MTKTARRFPTAALALLLIHSVSNAYGADAPAASRGDTPGVLTAGVMPGITAGVPLRDTRATQAGFALVPAYRSVEQLAAEVPVETREQARARAWRHRWLISLAPLVASQSLDAASSWGLRELNPILAGPDGRFGLKATAIKFGVIGGSMGAEYLIVRRFPASAKFFTVVNYATTGVTSGLAVHNYRLPGR